jgi:hypothetical protein
MKSARCLFYSLLSSVLCACNNSSSSNLAFESTGIWDVQINLVADDCGLVDPSESAFGDEYQINTIGSGTELSAASGLPVSASGNTEGSVVSFASEEQLDLIGDGSLCSQVVTVNYSDITESDATITFGFSVDCGEIFACSSLGLGQGIRR